jgi:hypothetical protein
MPKLYFLNFITHKASLKRKEHNCSVTTCYGKLTSALDSEALVPETLLSSTAGMVIKTNADPAGIPIYSVVAHFHSKR